MVFKEKWSKIPLEYVQNFPSIMLIKDMCTVSVMFPLISPIPVRGIKYNRDTSTYAQDILITGHSWESI
jgi:hypothetical protein